MLYEADDPKKFTKTKHKDSLSDIFKNKDSNPLAAPDSKSVAQNDPMDLPTASASSTRSKLKNLSPTDQMRDLMNRINPNIGVDEPGLVEPDLTDELVVRTANDVPSVMSTAMKNTGFQSPEWNTVNNLPGYQNPNIRGMGRQMFGMFTSTPLEKIKVIANLNGQGPNTTAEVRAVASWLHKNAEDLGDTVIDFGMAIPGYEPDVKEYKKNGIRFQVVRDLMGEYIYAYPDNDARIHGQSENKSKQKRLKDSVTEDENNISKIPLMKKKWIPIIDLWRIKDGKFEEEFRTEYRQWVGNYIRNELDNNEGRQSLVKSLNDVLEGIHSKIKVYDAKIYDYDAPELLIGWKLTENKSSDILKPSLFEQLKWDEELNEELIDESSLSKLIGKEAGRSKTR